MGRILRAALVVIAATGALASGADRLAAEDCATDYMRCAASIVTSDPDHLRDGSCDREYVRCLGKMIQFY